MIVQFTTFRDSALQILSLEIFVLIHFLLMEDLFENNMVAQSIAAILAYKTVPGTKYFRKVVHLSLHLIALVLGIVGIFAAFKYHNLNSIDNLYSLHSWFGLITIILFGVQVLLSWTESGCMCVYVGYLFT